MNSDEKLPKACQTPLSAVIEALEAKAAQLQSEIVEREAEASRKPLDALRAEQADVNRRLIEAKRVAAEGRQRQHREVRARYEAEVANAEAARRDFLEFWRRCSLALGRLVDLEASLSRDALALRAFQADDLGLSARANAALAPPNPQVEAGADLQVGTFSVGWNWEFHLRPAWPKERNCNTEGK